MTNSGCNEWVEAVLAASDPSDLFGQNEKRAKIRYRRLAKAVHPDSDGGSTDAMAHLNALWDEFCSRTGKRPQKDGKKRPREVMRDSECVVLDENCVWTVVQRSVSAKSGLSDVSDLRNLLHGSPVTVLKAEKELLIAQKDGPHRAFSCKLPEIGRIVPISGISGIVPGGKMAPEDLAWVSKRALFLVGALETLGKGISGFDGVAISPECHVMAVVAPWIVTDVAKTDRNSMLGAYLDAIWPSVGFDHASERIVRFVRGCAVDQWTGMGDILLEFDVLMSELFGGLRFHVMETC